MSNNKKKALLNEAATRRFWKLAGLKPIHEKAFVFEEEEELEEMRAKKEDEKDEVDEGMRGKKEDEDLDEGMRGKKEDEDLDEGMRGKKEDKQEVDEEFGGLKSSGIKGVYDMTARMKELDDEPEVEVTPSGTKITTAKLRSMDGKPVKKKTNEQDLEEEMEIDEMGMDAAAEDEPEMDMGAEEGPEDGQDVEVDVPEGDVASLRTARDILDQILSAVDGGDAEPEMDAEEPAMDDEPEMDMGDDDELNEVDQEELEEVAERIAQRVAKRIAESLKRK